MRKRSIPLNTIKGFGIGIAGPVGNKIGIIQNAPNLSGWNGINIKRILERKFNRPVICNNDANAACIAEKIFGSGRDINSFVYITVSTGIGSGIIIDNKLLMGANNNAAEFGHIVVDLNGPRCNCGKRGCLEALASGTSIANMARYIVSKNSKIESYKREYAYEDYRANVDKRFRLAKKTSFVGFHKKDNSDLRSEHIVKAAKKGDTMARYILWRSGYYLGVGISSLMHILNPEKIVLGGSVIRAGSLLLNPMHYAIKKHTWDEIDRSCKIEKTRLRTNVADVGTISLVVFKKGMV